MIFATDHPVGGDIMHDIYSHAHVHEIPELRSLALAHRAQAKQDAAGILTLFDTPPPPVAHIEYVHTKPWEPPHRRRDDSILDEMDDVDDQSGYAGFNPDDF